MCCFVGINYAKMLMNFIFVFSSYQLELSMIQILVCSTDHIGSVQFKGFGPDHVVEDFSVSFLLKRFF